MENNFTPIDIEKLKGENNKINTILLLIVTITMAVLAVMLFILIQKKIQTSNENVPSLPTITTSPEEKMIPTPEEEMISSLSPTVNFLPTQSATISPTIQATESAQ